MMTLRDSLKYNYFLIADTLAQIEVRRHPEKMADYVVRTDTPFSLNGRLLINLMERSLGKDRAHVLLTQAVVRLGREIEDRERKQRARRVPDSTIRARGAGSYGAYQFDLATWPRTITQSAYDQIHEKIDNAIYDATNPEKDRLGDDLAILVSHEDMIGTPACPDFVDLAKKWNVDLERAYS